MSIVVYMYLHCATVLHCSLHSLAVLHTVVWKQELIYSHVVVVTITINTGPKFHWVKFSRMRARDKKGENVRQELISGLTVPYIIQNWSHEIDIGGAPLP